MSCLDIIWDTMRRIRRIHGLVTGSIDKNGEFEMNDCLGTKRRMLKVLMVRVGRSG